MSIEETSRGENDQVPLETQVVEELEEHPKRPVDRWIESFNRHMNKDKPVRKLPEKAKRDRMKPVLLGLVASVGIVIILLGLFSTPMSRKRLQRVRDHRPPNLGRPQITEPLLPVPESPDHSVTPLMGASVDSQSNSARGPLVESDLRESTGHRVDGLPATTSVPAGSAQDLPAPRPSPSRGTHAIGGTYPNTLGQIEFSDTPTGKPESLAEVEARMARLESLKIARPTPSSGKQVDEFLSKPSLVYVPVAKAEPATRSPHKPEDDPFVQNSAARLNLPVGFRLMARLQTAVTTAVAAPVVAEVEYNYEKDGEVVVPAGSRIIGKLEEANSSGHISIKFTEIAPPDGGTYDIDGSAQALDFLPLKGQVVGKKNLARFVTRAATGVGVVAAQLVGMHGGLNGPINNSVLVRDRLAGNIAQAGDQQLQQMAISSSLVVTVPANTRLYVVIQSSGQGGNRVKMGHPSVRSRPEQESTDSSAPLTRAELEELRNLKQELRNLMLAAGGRVSPGEITSKAE